MSSIFIKRLTISITLDIGEGEIDGQTSWSGIKPGYTWAQIKERLTNVPTKEEYLFKHWSLEAEGPVIPDETVFNRNMIIYAVYEYNMVTITPNENGGSDVPEFKTTKGQKWAQIKSNFPAPTKAGHSFQHWSLTNSSSGEAIPDSHVFNENTQIYAIFLSDVTITFDTAGGSPSTSPITCPAGTRWSEIKSRVNTPSKSGYVFKGWDIK